MSKFRNENIIARQEEGEDGFDRRSFMKKALAIAGVVAAGKAIDGVGLDKIEQAIDNVNGVSSEEENHIAERVGKIESRVSESRRLIETDDAVSVSKIISYDSKGPIKINKEVIRGIESFWIKQYRENPKHRDSLIKAYVEMAPWESTLSAIFRNAGVQENMMYLAIPESYWDYFARSGAGAVGPYQFTESTGRSFGLKINDEIDERQNPIRAGKACANFIKSLLNSSHQNLNLALSGYNGGYIWKYLQQNSGEISYDKFLDFLERRINELRDNIKAMDHFEYQVVPGNTVDTLVEKFCYENDFIRSRLFRANLIKMNNIKADKLKAGSRIKIPMTSQAQKKARFNNQISDYVENLNYPAKFTATIAIIKDLEKSGKYKKARDEKKAQGLPVDFGDLSKTRTRDKLLAKG